MPLSLTELLPHEDYRFHMTLRRGDLEAFFAAPDPGVLVERRDWILRDPGKFVAAEDGARAAVAELWEWAASWPGVRLRTDAGNQDSLSRIKQLGESLSADFMLLTRERAEAFRLRAGAVCFPSSWALDEKMGRTLDEIHAPVPGLNPEIGGAIGQFLERLKPGAPYERANWGLAATPELNLHPSLGRPRLGDTLQISSTWLRIEDQVFAALPESGAILFGIGLRLLPLSGILKDARLRARLRRAVETMPEPLAAYKGIALIREPLLAACT